MSGVVFLWRGIGGGTPARNIHRFFVREAWSERGFKERALLIVGILLWPLGILTLVAACTARLGATARRNSGKGRARQVVEQLGLALSTGVPPPWYYIFELYHEENRARALEYLYRFETKRGVYLYLRTHLTSPETVEALADKLKFAQRCRDHDVPAIPVLALAREGQVEWLDCAGSSLPPISLFLKTLKGTGGKSAERWIYSEGRYTNAKGASLSASELVDHLALLSHRRPYIVRPLLENPLELRELCQGALSTVRVLSILDERGCCEITHAAFKMACRAGSEVDNAHDGGIAAPIDLETGEMRAATGLGLDPPGGRWYDCHPTTGAQITGRRVPHWDRVVEVARQAHAAFSDEIVVGWDIALLESGPVLVEGNKGPGVDVLQRCHRAPLGETRVAELLEYHLHRALEQKYIQRAHDRMTALGGARERATT